jgi:hypothetical protein
VTRVRLIRAQLQKLAAADPPPRNISTRQAAGVIRRHLTVAD